MPQSTEFAELKIGDKITKLPIYRASIGQNVIDVTKLYNETGYFTFDPGFMSTASCESTITHIDGDQGILRHRGYNIKELACSLGLSPFPFRPCLPLLKSCHDFLL